MPKTSLLSAFVGVVDRASGIIRGVSVITSGVEAKGHGFSIDHQTLESVMLCAEAYKDGVQVKVNHGTGFDSIVGSLRNFRIEGEKLLADLHLLKTHEMCPRVLEIAETMPASVGLSIAFSGVPEKKNGENFVRCTELYSCDLVDHPAANPSGLFSARVDSKEKGMGDNPEVKSFFSQLGEYFKFSKEVAAPVLELEAKLKAKSDELTAASGKVTELSTKISELEIAANKHADQLKELEASVESRASKKALELAAGQGIPPIQVKPEENPANKAQTELQKISELKGLAKVTALLELERKGK